MARGYGGGGKREIICLSLHWHQQNDSCIKMGSDDSNFSLIATDKVTSTFTQLLNSAPLDLACTRLKLLGGSVKLVCTSECPLQSFAQEVSRGRSVTSVPISE